MHSVLLLICHCYYYYLTRKWCQIELYLPSPTNRKSCVVYRTAPCSVTLNNPYPVFKVTPLFTSDNGGGICFRPHARVRLSVCLSVCWQDYSKTCAWIWMKCCVLTDVGTWTFEPDPDHSPDDGTGLLSPIAYALQREILLRQGKSHVLVLGARRSSDAMF